MDNIKQTLLIVDDAVENIDIVRGIFKSDYRIKVATSGKKALNLLDKADPKPDLILLDLIMPSMDGFETIKKLKKNEKTKDIPVIFLTSETVPEKIVEAFNLGAVDYVAKPFNIYELKSRVNTHLLIKKQRDFIEAQNIKYREVLHILSHDLNNSVGAIQMAIDIKNMNHEKTLDQFSSMIELATKNSINLIKMTCELCRIDEYSLEASEVNILQTFKEAELLLSKRLEDKHITLDMDIPDELTAYVEKRAFLNSVVLNLLTNAIKFSNENDSIRVHAESLSENNVMFSVKDYGIGIPESIAKSLFNNDHKKVRKGTMGEKGTGFGLPLVKKFVDVFGGTIKVISKTVEESPDDHGTEFKIELFSKKV